MSSDAAGFIGNIPQHYDQGLGPIIFAEYAGRITHEVAGRFFPADPPQFYSVPSPATRSIRSRSF
jgi:hypothetical protein